jgi:hypothetical protein
MMKLNLTIQPRRIGLFLGLIALLLAAQSLLTEYLVEEVIHPDADNVLILILDLFSVNLEDSLPTWYSTINLFVAAAILFSIAIAKFRATDHHRWYWLGLSTLFLYLSMDEGAVIHEILAEPLHDQFNTSGYLEFGWQIIAIPLVILFGLLYFRFWIKLPPHTRLWFAIAAVVYAGGALIIEGISANEASSSGINMKYLTIATLEEMCEMLGVVIFIYALLTYIVQSDLHFSLQPPASETPRPTPLLQSAHFRRGMAAVGLLILLVNMAFIYGANRLKDPSTRVIERTTPTHHLIADQLRDDGVVVTQLSGAFNLENLPARQLAAALLTNYQNVMILSLVGEDLSLIFAADTLPLNVDGLTALLHDNGETEFVIYDTPVVQVFAENATPEK